MLCASVSSNGKCDNGTSLPYGVAVQIKQGNTRKALRVTPGTLKRSVTVSCYDSHLYNLCMCNIPLTQWGGVFRGARHCWGAALRYPWDSYVRNRKQSNAGSSPSTVLIISVQLIILLYRTNVWLRTENHLRANFCLFWPVTYVCTSYAFSRVSKSRLPPLPSPHFSPSSPRSQRLSPEKPSALHAFGASLGSNSDSGEWQRGVQQALDQLLHLPLVCSQSRCFTPLCVSFLTHERLQSGLNELMCVEQGGENLAITKCWSLLSDQNDATTAHYLKDLQFKLRFQVVWWIPLGCVHTQPLPHSLPHTLPDHECVFMGWTIRRDAAVVKWLIWI